MGAEKRNIHCLFIYWLFITFSISIKHFSSLFHEIHFESRAVFIYLKKWKIGNDLKIALNTACIYLIEWKFWFYFSSLHFYLNRQYDSLSRINWNLFIGWHICGQKHDMTTIAFSYSTTMRQWFEVEQVFMTYSRNEILIIYDSKTFWVEVVKKSIAFTLRLIFARGRFRKLLCLQNAIICT